MKIDMNQERLAFEPNGSLTPISQKKSLNLFVLASLFVHAMVATAVIAHQQNRDEEASPEEFTLQLDMGAPAETAIAPESAVVADVAAAEVGSEPQVATSPEFLEDEQPVISNSEIKKNNVPAAAPVVSRPETKIQETQPQVETKNIQPEVIPVQTEANKPETQSLVVSAQEERVEADLDEETAQAEKELEEASQKQIEEIQKQKEEAQALAAARIAKMKEEQAALAEAEAAAAQNAAEEEAAQMAAEQANEAQASQAVELAENQKGSGSGSQNVGPGEPGAEVRSLEQLRQMPGNPKPSYDAEERFKGHQGIVVFQAYVTTEGRLQDFRMLQSSGYKNLDAKTLKALKQWKFYAGQAGWVELPFNWNLKGGPQEMPALLRRKIGKGSK